MSKTFATVFLILLIILFSLINVFWLAVLCSKHRILFSSNLNFFAVDIIILGLVSLIIYLKRKR